MSSLIVGEQAAAIELAEAAADAEKHRIWAGETSPAGEPQGSSATLARALAGFEAEVLGRQPTSVLLADDSETALAAALVATKLGIAIAAAPAAIQPASDNARLIAQLAAA